MGRINSLAKYFHSWELKHRYLCLSFHGGDQETDYIIYNGLKDQPNQEKENHKGSKTARKIHLLLVEYLL